jgi:uncharacterized protein (DUF1501 family)
MPLSLTRRDFLRRAGYTVGGAALASAIDQLSIVNALAQPPSYKALVCIFLLGGNDCNNTIVPLSASTDPTGGYTAYQNTRKSSGLAIPQSGTGSLLPISPNPPSCGGGAFGFHPNLVELQKLWAQGKLAVVANVGPLIVPLTRQQYQSGKQVPYQLFSHADQQHQWQNCRSDAKTSTGWGGRTADRTADPTAAFPLLTSLAGTPTFTVGTVTSPLAIASAPTPLNQILVLSGFGGAADEQARRMSFDYLRTIDLGNSLVTAAGAVTQQALVISQALTVDPTIQTVFPNTTLGNQLKQVAKVIKANLTQPALGLSRQIFFCQLGGFDTHQTELSNQGGLLTQVSQAMQAFYNATIELGVSSQVTQFTLSDFGRTLQPSGSGAGSVGTDHGWGSHHFVLGDAVNGGDFYGLAGPTGIPYPKLQLGGPNDTDNRGRWIPTTSVEQYAATLATWFGLAAQDLPYVFPLLANFNPSNVGFI